MTTWACSTCLTENGDDAATCLVCGADRGATAPEPERTPGWETPASRRAATSSTAPPAEGPSVPVVASPSAPTPPPPPPIPGPGADPGPTTVRGTLGGPRTTPTPVAAWGAPAAPPVGAPAAPVAAPATAPPAPERRPSRAPLVVGIIVIALLAGMVGGLLIARGGDADQTTTEGADGVESGGEAPSGGGEDAPNSGGQGGGPATGSAPQVDTGSDEGDADGAPTTSPSTAPTTVDDGRPFPAGSWVVVRGSFQSEADAAEVAAGIPGATVLDTDLYASLTPDYHAVVIGPFASGSEAVERCLSDGLGSRNDCFGAPLTDDPGDRDDRAYPDP